MYMFLFLFICIFMSPLMIILPFSLIFSSWGAFGRPWWVLQMSLEMFESFQGFLVDPRDVLRGA